MSTTTVSDAVVVPQDPGTGTGSSASDYTDPTSAAAVSLLAAHENGEYVERDYANGLAFTRSASNDTIGLDSGACYIRDTSSSTSNQRGSGGNPQVQSAVGSGYDTELPEGHVYCVVLPTATAKLAATANALNDVYLSIDPTSNNSVTLHVDTAAPSNPYIKIGQANPDNSADDIRLSDDPNNVHWCSSPDEMAAVLGNEPDHGTVVKLIPGQYTDSDWSTRIDLPNHVDVHYHVDMRGSHIDLNSFSPTNGYIHKATSGTLGQKSIEFYGPAYTNLSGVTSPPPLLDLNDIQSSIIYVPGGEGAVEAVVRNEQTQGSGHMNRMAVHWTDCKKGYDLIGQPNNPTNDRSFYWGQLLNIADVGVDVTAGSNNFFYVQPENGQGSATGYRTDVDCENNRIWMTHSKTATPLDIEGRRNFVDHPIPAPTLDKSLLAVKPTDLNLDDEYTTSAYNAIDDFTSMVDTPGNGSVNINNFKRARIIAGSNDGNAQAIRSVSRLGLLSRNYHIYSHFKLNTTTNAIYRWGIGQNASNWIGLYADSANSDWRFKHVDGGTVQTNVALDTPKAQDTSLHEFIATIDDNNQRFFYEGEHIHSQADNFSLGASGQKYFIQSENSGGTNAQIQLIEFQYIGD